MMNAAAAAAADDAVDAADAAVPNRRNNRVALFPVPLLGGNVQARMDRRAEANALFARARALANAHGPQRLPTSSSPSSLPPPPDLLKEWSMAPESRRYEKAFVLRLLHEAKTLPSADDFERRFPPSLRIDRDVVLAFARRDDFCMLYENRPLRVPDILTNDKDVMLEYCRKIPRSLQECSYDLMDDADVVLAAIQRDYRELQYASMRLQDDEHVVRAACAQDGRALDYCRPGSVVRDKLVRDYDFVYDILRRNGCSMYKYVPEPLRDNRELFMIAVRRGLLQCAGGVVHLKEHMMRAVSYQSTLYLGLAPIWQRNADVALQAVTAADATAAVIDCALTTVPSLWNHPLSNHALLHSILARAQTTTMTGYPVSTRLVEVAQQLPPPAVCTPDLILNDHEFVCRFMRQYHQAKAATSGSETSFLWPLVPRAVQCNRTVLLTAIECGVVTTLSPSDWPDASLPHDASFLAAAVAVRSAIYEALLSSDNILRFNVNVAKSAITAPDATSDIVNLALSTVPSILLHDHFDFDVDFTVAAAIMDKAEEQTVREFVTKHQATLVSAYSDVTKALVLKTIKRCPELYPTLCVNGSEFWNDADILRESITSTTAVQIIHSRHDVWAQHVDIVVRAIEVAERNDEDMIRFAVQAHESDVFDSDRAVQMAWIKRPTSRMYPSWREAAMEDRELALLLAEHRPAEFKTVGTNFFDDIMFMMEAFARNGEVMECASPEIRRLLDLEIPSQAPPGTCPTKLLTQANVEKYIRNQLQLHDCFVRDFMGAVVFPYRGQFGQPPLPPQQQLTNSTTATTAPCLLPLLDIGNEAGGLKRIIAGFVGIPTGELLRIYRQHWG